MRLVLLWLVVVLAWPPTSAAQGRVETRHLDSRALGAGKAITVYLPHSYPRSHDRFPVAYYLHGSAGNERSWVDRLALDSVADSLHDEGLPEVILVMPDGDSGFWMDWEEPEGFRARCHGDPLRREEPVASYCVAHGRYESYLVNEIVPFVDTAYRTLTAPRHRAVAGFSMGGYGAFYLAARHPELFAAAVSHSGGVYPMYLGPHPASGEPMFAEAVSQVLARWPSRRWPLLLIQFGRDTSGWWARDPFRQIERLLSEGSRVPHLYFDVGSSDRYADQSRAFADTLRKRGVPHVFKEWPGDHDRAFWRDHAGEGLAWVLSQIGP